MKIPLPIIVVKDYMYSAEETQMQQKYTVEDCL